MTTEIGVFRPDEAREIRRRVLHTNRAVANVLSHKDKKKLGWHYVILKEQLTPASNPLTGYTQADAAVIRYEENNPSLDMIEVAGEENYITITNRSPSFSGDVGDLVLVRWIIKEWVPVIGAGLTIVHGIVTAQLGCGYYTVELGEWSGDYTISGSGVGSDDPSDIDANCNVCVDVINEDTEECAITLSYPPCPVTGIDEYVTAYHAASALVPLKVGSACRLTNMSDTDSGISSYVDDTDDIWQILDGLQEHTVQYKDRYDCCPDGTRVLVGRTPVIFAAKVCDEISCGSCPSEEA